MSERADEIDSVLRKAHVFSLYPSQRKEAAALLAGRGVKASQVAAVWKEAVRSSDSEDRARSFFGSILKEPARFLEVIEDLEREEGRRGEPTSGMQWVCEGNPFGWSHPEHHRINDHSRPGEWNECRQSFNLTLEKMRELGLNDVHRQGCSRFEVLGYGDWEKAKRIHKGTQKPGEEIQDASPVWDPLVVEMAQKHSTAAFKNNNPGKVYGEGG